MKEIMEMETEETWILGMKEDMHSLRKNYNLELLLLPNWKNKLDINGYSKIR